MNRYEYEIHVADVDVDEYGNRSIKRRGLWVTATSIAHVGRLVGMTPGQVSYAMQHQGQVGWNRMGGGGSLFRIVRKWRKPTKHPIEP